MEPLGYLAAMSATRQSMLSALPDAPVVPDRARRVRDFSVAVRAAGARGLHRLADRLEPRGVRVECT